MFEGEVAHRVLERLRLSSWLKRFPRRLVSAAFVFLNGFLAVGLLTCLAVLFHTPFVFPSVGPTAFAFFFHPLIPTASPRNALCGHAIGIACGYGALWLMGLEHLHAPSLEDLHWSRVVAAGLSLAATGALMIAFGVVHPPAGATTLIVSLGLITAPIQLVVIELAVALMAVQAIVVNRLAGIDYPLWAKRVHSPGPGK